MRKKTFTHLAISACIFIFSTGNILAQDILFEEDFETSPVTSLVNTGDLELKEGPSPCSFASRGMASDFNSTNVDFMASENSSYYVAVNPESPCMGFYSANLTTTTNIDLSTAIDSIVLEFRYFISSTLGWGGAGANISISSGDEIIPVGNFDLSARNTWTTFRMKLNFSLPAANDGQISINMGGGEGVALDDIKILGYSGPITHVVDSKYSDLMIFPNPVQEIISWNGMNEFNSYEIFDISGQVIQKGNILSGQQNIVTENLENGIYFLLMSDSEGKTYKTKFMKN